MVFYCGTLKRKKKEILQHFYRNMKNNQILIKLNQKKDENNSIVQERKKMKLNEDEKNSMKNITVFIINYFIDKTHIIIPLY